MSSNPISNRQVNYTNEDDTAIKAMLQETIELRRKADIIRSLPDLIVAFDISGHIFFASQSVLEFIGLVKADEIEGKSFWDLFDARSKVLIQKSFDEALAAELKEEDDDSTPLDGGMPLNVRMVLQDEQGRIEAHQVSLKGTACVNNNVPECVCSLRLVGNVDTSLDASKVVVSDHEEGKAKNDSALLKRNAGAQAVHKRKFDDSSVNQVSDEGSSK